MDVYYMRGIHYFAIHVIIHILHVFISCHTFCLFNYNGKLYTYAYHTILDYNYVPYYYVANERS